MNGIFVLAELSGAARERVRAVHGACDPRLGATSQPHVTIAGSSGVGPIPLGTRVADIRAALAPVTAATAPMTVRLGPPVRFMQTDIVVLPIDPNGPLRALHERIALSGLRFEATRFTFTPHVTLSFYPTLTPELRRRLFAVRINEPVRIDRILLYRTVDPQPGQRVLELELTGREAHEGVA